VVLEADIPGSEPIDRVCAHAHDQAAQLGAGEPVGGVGVDGLLRRYYQHVSVEDLAERSEVDLYGAAMSHLGLARQRPQGTALVRVFTPTVPVQGWSARGHTVVEVVTDDMPFLVDSVTMALEATQHDVHLVIHPQFVVRRDMEGELQEVLDDHRSAGAHDLARESWMHLEIDRVAEEKLADLEAALLKVLTDVREAVEDWDRMHVQADRIIEELGTNPPPLPEHEVAQARALLGWLADNHFTFLGYREYRLSREGDDEVLTAVPGTGYGILRSDPSGPTVLPPLVAERARERKLLVLAKANSRATVHRPVYLDYVGVKTYDASGEIVGEKRFLGLFSSAAYTESITRIPLLREKAEEVLAQAGFEAMSHAGKALMDVLETYPRDELFQTPTDQLVPIASQVMHIRERRQLRLFVRRDIYGRFVSCLVYLPRDRYNTAVRERLARILRQQLNAETVEYTAHVGESFAARLHFVVRPEPGRHIDEIDVPELERRLADAARSWRDDFQAAVLTEYGEETGSRLARAYADSFPEAYKEDYPARTGAVDLGQLEALAAKGEDDGIDLSLYERIGARSGEVRLKVYRLGAPLSLSQVLPMLSDMGVEVIDERPYELENLDRARHIYDFGLRYHTDLPHNARELFQDAVAAVWDGRNESDRFNALVLAAGLTWRQVSVMRAYARYLRQGSTPFALDSFEDALRENVAITRDLVALFEARFDPATTLDPADAQRTRTCEQLVERITAALDEVSSLDHDRILRSYLTVIQSTLRTSYFQTRDGATKSYISFKLDPAAIPELPEPRPRFEIFCYSPRVEGVHLRFGAVARGGLRWSDRRDDFRTEVLGLVKAQMVKNTVIVPVGAKGGFYCKQLPDPAVDRDAWLAEGIACYRTFISSLLDLTDNIVAGKDGREVLPPPLVVRHDPDDTYLVVAADKGTATFSDIANGISQDYGFWLGDAFASGGSVGYDHKAMGITAKGAWVSVQRHFREMGIDSQTEEFTCVGIGDMSGDVFGNGLLCSPTTKLVAAFDHRDIFLDPNPDPETSYAERARLFALPRSSWKDYDAGLISAGGGVFPRSAKSIPLSPQVQEALGVQADRLTPAELMRAILLAPVDLLWNGGIGTYVKARSESHADVGDKANDAIRVDGRDLRVRCVGEGGNLGLTQRGRIEYAERDGRINTDFIDNSAGVDTSDHEVNIKILLDHVVSVGDLTGKQRNDLLASMTDEVAELVLNDNYQQNLALANSLAQAPALLHVHEDWMRSLERDGLLNRELEALPSRREVAKRLERREGLTSPEMAVLMSYTKIVLAEQLLETDLADDPFFRNLLFGYFPSKMRQGYRQQMEEHQLRREIVVTELVNYLVNRAGITYFHRLSGETAAGIGSLARANFVAREIFGAPGLWQQIADLDNSIDAAVQTRMRIEVRTLVERASRWIVSNRRPPLDSEALVDQFEVPVQRLMQQLPELMEGLEREAWEARRDGYVEAGVPEELAAAIAACAPAYMLLGIVETSARDGIDAAEVARVHFAIGERLGLPRVVARILALPRDDRWQTMARAALRDDLHAVHAQLTAQELAGAAPHEDLVVAAAEQLAQVCGDEKADLARMSVALRIVRSLVA